MDPIMAQAALPRKPQYIVRLLGVILTVLAVALMVWGHWLAGAIIIAAMVLSVWDDRRMTTQAEEEANDPENRPFPDLEKWKRWDSNS